MIYKKILFQFLYFKISRLIQRVTYLLVISEWKLFLHQLFQL